MSEIAAAEQPAAPPATGLDDEADRRRARWVGLVIGLAIVAAIGGPLLGVGVFHGADTVLEYAPWSYEAPPGFEAANSPVGDTVNAAMPMRLQIRARLLEGDLPLWTRDQGSGVPLMSVPDLSSLSPILLPYWVLPAWYAPAVSKALELAIAVAFTALFARRLGRSRVAALTAGMVYAFSGFQVVWTNWPQTTVGAFIPMLFWAIERALAERTLRSALPVAAAVGLLLVGGFPAVTGFALLAAGVYSLVRVSALRSEPLASRITGLATLAAMVVLGTALVAVQVVPFLDHLAGLETGHRLQNPHGHLPLEALATMAVPMAFGPTSFGPYWGPKNIVEINTFVGVVAVTLLVVAAARRRPRLPPGAAGALWGLSGASVLLIFLGGIPLGLMQRALPFLFGTNAVGRLRSVLGLLLATLAAVGLDALLQRRPGRLTRREVAAAAVLVVGMVGVGGMALRTSLTAGPVLEAYPAAASAHPWVWPALLGLVGLGGAVLWALRTPRRRAVAVGLLAGSAILVLAVVALGPLGFYPATVARVTLAPVVVATCLGAVLWRHTATGDRRVLTIVVPVLVALEVVAFANPYWSRSQREHFYPVTETHEFLAENLAQSRVALSDRTMQPGTTGMYGIPSLTAHMFYSPEWRDLVLEVDPTAFDKPTFPFLHVQRDDLDGVASHPVLDRLSTRYFVVDPSLPVFGTRHEPPDTGRDVLLTAGEPMVGSVPSGDLRGVRVAILPPGYVGTPDEPAWLHADVLDADGAVLATSGRRVEDQQVRDNFTVPVPQVDLEGPVRVRLRLEAPTGATLLLGASNDRPALGHVTSAGSETVRPVWTRGAVVYEQEGWLPRVRWASRQEVVPGASDRLARLGSDDLPDDTVVLNEPGPPAAGRPASIEVVKDTGDELVLEVDATGAGYVVVADGLHFGWQAEVDGVAAPVRVADHALGAVAVPEGQHRVVLRFAPPSLRVGAVVSLLAVITLAGLLLVTRRRDRRPQPGSV